MIIDPTTFEATGTETLAWDEGRTREVGTVEATLAGETRRVDAVRYAEGRIVSWSFGGRYRTSTKVWPATICVDGDREMIQFGKDHHTGRCIKNQIFFA